MDHPLSFGDYRPISLCNLCYKLISKVAALRLKPFLDSSISSQQFGFLKNRLIHAPVAITQEVIHSVRTKKKSAIILKLDLTKAFDRVNWTYIRLILIQIGVPLVGVNWIMGCITSANFAVLVNGSPSTFFPASRGIRQGCPLSPLLFILVIEGLSLLIEDARRNGLIRGIKISENLSITHLLFVDDVILFGVGTFEDWYTFQIILDKFCDASGMKINLNKSVILHENIEEDMLHRIAGIMPYRFSHLNEGFTYLGFFLKPSGYLIKDWMWLISKFEHRISHWTYRLLTLGGRLVLVRAVLTSLPVYWFALFPIPSAILDKLRKLIYSFLWGSSDKQKRYHLADWHLLARPTALGGWGIKNLPLFNISLRMKNFWFALHQPGIWNLLLKEKYMKHMAVHDWLRKKCFSIHNASIIWNGFLSTIHWIGYGLSWQVGNGRQIKVGADPMVGMDCSYILSDELRHYLLDYGISTLDQAFNYSTGVWFTALELDLCDEWSYQWNLYIKGLRSNRILLKEEPDTLLWTYDTHAGPITAAWSYACLINSQVDSNHYKDLFILWRLKIPLKMICFTWLLMMDRILTWDHLQSRGFHGPGICIFCNRDFENCDHFFLRCPFTCHIINHFAACLGFTLMPLDSLHTTLTHWFSTHACYASYLYAPVFIFWYIWLHRNSCIFDDQSPFAPLLIARIESALSLFPVPQKTMKTRLIGPQPAHFYPVAYFDGAAKDNHGGAGFMIYLSETHHFGFSVGCGDCTNTRAELMALWSVIRVCLMMGLPIKMIYGDSLVIISWVNGTNTLDVPTLKHWCDDIIYMLRMVPPVSFNHIYREHNSLADGLSKQALLLDLGSGHFTETMNGLDIREGHFSLF